jgi:hypothetical protein
MPRLRDAILATVLASVGSPAIPAVLPVDGLSDAIEARLVALHNEERTRVGVEPMRWSQRLAADAAAWGRHLAGTGGFEHDPQDGPKAEGENLWMGTRGNWRVEGMVAMWSDEKRIFRPGRFPENSSTGSWHDVGHYTQMVWRGTREVGCAVVSNARDDYLVCRYAQAGNVMGETPF